MRKVFWILPVVLIVLISLVSAVDLAQGSNQIIQWVIDIFAPILNALIGDNWYGAYLFEKVLLLTIMIVTVYIILEKVPLFQAQLEDKPALLWILDIAVSILAVRMLTSIEIIETALLPYTVLGVALTAALPLVIFFYFVEVFTGDEQASLRKILWLFFAIVFMGLWWSRYDELALYDWNISWIYFFTGVASLIFLLADGTIRRFYMRQKWKQMGMDSAERYAIHVREALDKLHERWINHVIPPNREAYYQSERRRLEKELRNLAR